jgi:hypothetical protein
VDVLSEAMLLRGRVRVLSEKLFGDPMPKMRPDENVQGQPVVLLVQRVFDVLRNAGDLVTNIETQAQKLYSLLCDISAMLGAVEKRL